MPTRRLYYDDAFLREFSAEALRCEPARHDDAATWRVVLDQTAFYPDSGGQPSDTGLLGEARVLEVSDAGDEVVHLLDRPVPLGPIRGQVDWPRRFDHMQQHTGQHLLSAIFHERYSLPTVSFHLGGELSTIDLRGQEPTEALLEEAERAANAIIFESRPVRVRYGTAEELDKLGVRKKVEREGKLRALEIEGVDLQPCGGTHVASTGQIGLLLLRRVAKIRQDWRVEFVCGERARRAARALSERLAEAEARLLAEDTPPRPGGLRIVSRVLPDASADYLGLLATALAKHDKTIALLASGGYLVYAQHESAAQDMNQLLRDTLQTLGGKGGGQRNFARGRLHDPGHSEQAVTFAKERCS
ncbi:MAG: alanyl-tRNA editing protein [Acidobacteriia bacterium]|nr:alanyl-tRNA editing protein [Terriglobia bacterium]